MQDQAAEQWSARETHFWRFGRRYHSRSTRGRSEGILPWNWTQFHEGDNIRLSTFLLSVRVRVTRGLCGNGFVCPHYGQGIPAVAIGYVAYEKARNFFSMVSVSFSRVKYNLYLGSAILKNKLYST